MFPIFAGRPIVCDTDARHSSCIEIDIVSLDRPIYLVVSLVEV